MKSILFFTALFLLILGQPHIVPMCSFAPALFAYALFFLSIRSLPTKQRFWAGSLFFFCYQLTALFWLTSHPFGYAYAVLLILSALFGAQFGIACLFAAESDFLSLRFLAIPAIATLFEYSRLFYFSGYALHPIGLPASDFFLTKYVASYIGILGLTFFTLLINCLLVRAILLKRFKLYITVLALLGISCAAHTFITKRAKATFDAHTPPLRVLVFQVKELPEELDNKTGDAIIAAGAETWKAASNLLATHTNEQFDFVLFPEIFVPFPAASPLFSFEEVSQILLPFNLAPLPEAETSQFSSLEIASLLSQRIQAPFIIGLEGATFSDAQNKNIYFNSAFSITVEPQRYDKMILLPMGEYIPFSFLKPLAAQYGLFDSFTRGKGVVLFPIDGSVIAPTICYEDTFSWISRAAVRKGAKGLVNVTNDGWFPDSTLGIIHAAHGRIRSLEEGVPLIRSCNFGTSGAYDALGNGVELHSFKEMKSPIETFTVSCSQFTYPTLYRWLGDMPLILLSIVTLIFLAKRSKKVK